MYELVVDNLQHEYGDEKWTIEKESGNARVRPNINKDGIISESESVRLLKKKANND